MTSTSEALISPTIGPVSPRLVILTAATLLFTTNCATDQAATPSVSPAYATLIAANVAEAEAAKVKSVVEYAELRTPGQPFSLLELDPSEQRAFEILEQSPFWSNSLDQINEGNYLVELFSVVQPSGGDVEPDYCLSLDRCRRLEFYDYTNNSTLTAYVDVERATVSDAFVQEQKIPDIPGHLIDIAVDLATKSSAVQTEIDSYEAVTDSPVMAATKTDLDESRCERQDHLCVAPTFLSDDGAVWAIVNLTELNIAGVAWTRFDPDDKPESVEPMTLRRAEKSAINSYCDQSHELSTGSWTGDYQLTSSDGLHITDLRFDGTLVAASIKLVDWHVSYSTNDGFGYSDAIGCPAFAQAAVIAADVPIIRKIDDQVGEGFTLDQDYWSEAWPAPCSYNYRQSLRLYDDGTFRPVATSQGKGCGDSGIYRPVFRISLPPDLSTIDGKRSKEWWVQSSEEKDTFELGSNYVLHVSADQLNEEEQPHPAWVYFTEGENSAEGASELVTIGPCCNSNHEQGPERFVDGETLSGKDTVVWFVPELHNNPTPGEQACWVETVVGDDGLRRHEITPCSAGPLFRPTSE